MNKIHITLCIDNNIALLVRKKYSSNRQLSSLVNDFLKNIIDLQNPEEEKLKEEITELNKKQLKFKSLIAEKETILEMLSKQKNKQSDEKEKERVRKAILLSDSIGASGISEDWG